YQSDLTNPDLHSFPTRRSSDLPECQVSSINRSVRSMDFGDKSSCHRILLVFRKNGFLQNRFPVHYSVMRLCLRNFTEIPGFANRSEEHTSELQSRENLVCRLLL